MFDDNLEDFHEVRMEDDDDGGQGKSDEEAKEDTRRVVQPKIHTRRPRIKLDALKLTGNHGIGDLESVCERINFRGKGHELADLNSAMTQLEHWAHCLFPKMTFDDFLDKVEDLGSKRAVVTYVTKIRLGMEIGGRDSERQDSSSAPVVQDPFDLI